ncbi:hypothetical protein GQ43DRAFT_494259 [Delitschia confertaspora ATCC 74209]|uniref:Uncharacterized protein n=1 Tax=Delitschia confertaspora ATCC 74209 TaxID=1513339 RepID=A0A9P4JWB8_9PLEO|nr:hypothetical protein GQ43DRAFT_494259 [Delitschia confertaspora ATCC 74209]
MSSSAGGGPSTAEQPDKRRSLGKYVKRMSSVFKRNKTSKQSTPKTPAVPSTLADSSSAPAIEATAKLPSVLEPAPTPTAEPIATPDAPSPITQTLNRSALQQERARALFAKYGLTLESHEWITSPGALSVDVKRVEKPIRMRVHRSCHHCGTTFGADKACSNCEHKRCKKCPRFPKKRTPGEKSAKTEGEERPKKKRAALAVTSKNGNELVYQTTQQRVRRSCHKCETLFVPPTSTVCSKCHHARCTKCPRDPAKLEKWQHGYLGDVEGDEEGDGEGDFEKELAQMRRMVRKPRIRVRWTCEECSTVFLEGSAQCPGCGHERCEKCTRKPLKRIKKEKEFDPDLVQAVEAKLKALGVGKNHPQTVGGG